MTLAQIKKARKGDSTAYKYLLDSAHGLPKQQIENTNIDVTWNEEKTYDKDDE